MKVVSSNSTGSFAGFPSHMSTGMGWMQGIGESQMKKACREMENAILFGNAGRCGMLSKAVVFSLIAIWAVPLVAAIDLADKGGAYTATTADLQTDFVNSGLTTATLTFDFSSAESYGGSISGDIKVVKKGGGELTFTSASTFTGGVDVNNGTVVCATDNALGVGLVTLASGKRIRVVSGAVCPNDIYLSAGTCYVSFGASGGTYAGNVTGASGVSLTPETATAGSCNLVTGSVTIPGGTISMPDGQARTVRFYGPVSVATVSQNSAYHRTAPYFYSTENDFGCLKLKRQQKDTYSPYFAPGAIPHDCCFTGQTANALNVVSFGGAQQARHVSAEKDCLITMNATEAGALTLTDSANGPYVLFNGDMDLVFAPEDGGNWSLTNGASTMTGALTVSNAVMVVEQGASFKKLTKAVIAPGAGLKVSTSVANAFAALTGLTVYGKLEVCETANAPFSASGLEVRIEGDGKLKIASEVTLNVPLLSVEGVYLAGGTYTRENCSWIEGEGFVVVANSGISSWAAAVDGTWSDAEKWVSGVVPGNEKTFVTANQDSYTVTIDCPVLNPVTTLIGNASGKTSTVEVATDVRLRAADAVVEVVRGGVFDVRSGTFTSSNTQGRVCKATDGGVWRVSGGMCDFRTQGSSLSITDGGRLEITAGTMSLQDIKYTYSNPFSFNNGTIDITGGALQFINKEGEFNPLGSGEITIGGTGVLSIARGWVGPRTPGRKLHLVTKDEGVLNASGVLSIGDTLTGGETLAELNSTKKGAFGFEAIIGCNRSCRVQVDVNPGATFETGGYGLRIATTEMKKDTVACFPTGIVNVVSGNCTVLGEWYGADYGNAGTHVGGTLSTANGYSCHHYGELNLSDSATYLQSRGILGVGLSQGTGLVSVDTSSTLTKNGGGEAIIGAFGGSGYLLIDGGGKVSFSKNMFVGGIEKASLEYATGYSSADFETTAARGCVEVSDGELSVGGNLVVGERGTGIVRIGPGGVVRAKDLEMKDSISSALFFKFGADGVGSLVLSGAASISPQAKITVDLTEYAGALKRAPLIKTQEISGAFDDGHVTIVGCDGATLAYRTDGLYVKGPPSGLIIYVR